MQKESTYPDLYIAGDTDTRTLIPGLCMQGYYVLLLRNRAPENETWFGRRYYDYSDATLTCCRPGLSQSAVYMKNPLDCRWIVAFRPELFEEAPSEKDLSDYTFFAYQPQEALHLSVAETHVLVECIEDICVELRRPRDQYSSCILARHIGRILDYTVRFYERQFITREWAVEKTITAYDHLLRQYMETGQLRTRGLPDAKYCADRLRLSEACLCDMLKQKTGHTHDNYVQIKRIEIAKCRLTTLKLPLQQIVTDLGFPSIQYFNYLFKKLTGCSPNGCEFPN
ncbi:AraC family transcriptional regulator [uncultured Odoribacter sp.]|uniref:helix-turn-helix domain-containing protein n=1 Tax=uncultured Odoribacter sp. TaxID=876416 RepID=UPI002633C33C|nr:helix-turn-helix domain-containing protein [uncultured Odoribacter sp.]